MNTHVEDTQKNKRESAEKAPSPERTGIGSSFQFGDHRAEAMAQRKFQAMADNSPQTQRAAQFQTMADKHSAENNPLLSKSINNTGLPDNLKSGIESLSGLSMDDVKVHYNSGKPAQLQAHAFAQGADIFLASGQEKHLPHEAWHVVQQKQGRVKPVKQMMGKVQVNDDEGLEKEADIMGAKAATVAVSQRMAEHPLTGGNNPVAKVSAGSSEVVQRVGALTLLGAAAAFGYFGYKVREWWMNWRNLPEEAYARNDTSLTLVTQTEIADLLDSAVQDGVLPDGLRQGLLATATELINRGLLLWTGTGAPHAEVIVKDHSAGRYRVNIVVVIPKSTNQAVRDLEVTDALERGQAIHELIHAFEVVSKIGGPQNLGEQVDEVKEGDQVLTGNQLQWSTIPEDESTGYLNELKELFEKDVRGKPDVQWGYYLERLNYGLANRHEFPTVISQIVHDIHGLGAQVTLKDTGFYARLIQIRDIVVRAATG